MAKRVRLRLGSKEQWWVVRREAFDGDEEYGHADFENRIIYISPGLKVEEVRDTLIHEVAHVCLPDLSEEAVRRLERQLGKALNKFGFMPD